MQDFAFYLYFNHLTGKILRFILGFIIIQSEAVMRIITETSDVEVLHEIGDRLKKIRIDSLKTQEEIAVLTGVSLRTINNMEAGKDVSFSTIVKVMRALRILQNLDTAIPEPGIRPSDVIKLGKHRERVRKTVKPSNTWKWGDEK